MFDISRQAVYKKVLKLINLGVVELRSKGREGHYILK